MPLPTTGPVLRLLTPLLALLPALLPAVLALSQDAAAQQRVDFNREVRPILADKCFQCHGPDGKHRKGKLRFDVRAVAFAPRGDQPAAIVPGDTAASELVRRITHTDPEQQMPPQSFGKQLTAKERTTLVDWVRQGATWQDHWAFVPPQPIDVPRHADSDWPRNAIDQLILTRLRAEQLQPSPPADRRTLIRRITLDLTGLPPTPDEVRAFLRDDTEDAFEKVVDRLLGTQAYGEHMARFWLDAARYGDTHGLHLDNYREMWLYRDWVVRAFHENKPFDVFTVEQIAGDMLPNATVDQRIASGFNRCHVSTNEGGSIKEEVYVRNVIDRVSTTGTVFLGLTLGCAVCHDHKFDPIKQKEFYQLFAFFNNLDADPMDGNAKAHPPVIRVPSDDQTETLARLQRDRAAIDTEIQAALRTVEYTEPAPAKTTEAPHAEIRRETLVWIDDALPEGAHAEGNGLVWVEAPRHLVHAGRLAMQRTSVGNQQHFFRNAHRKLRVGAGDTLFAWVYVDPANPPRAIMLQWNGDGDSDWSHRAYWGENVIPFGKDGTSSKRHMGALPAAGRWTRLAVPAALVGLRPGQAVHGIAFTQFDGTSYWDTIGIETATPQTPADYVWIDDAAPKGAKLQGEGRNWQWQKDGPVHRGNSSLRRQGKGLIQDFFSDASQPLRLQAGDRLFAHVWLDPKDPPRSIQLQFHGGPADQRSWNHRARWGAAAHGKDLKDGADYVAGQLPQSGEWVRLEVPIEKVGLAPGHRIDGWAFTQVDGSVRWDTAGLRTWAPPDNRHLTSQRAWEHLAPDDDSISAAIKKAIAVEAAERTPTQARSIRDHYLRHVYSGTREIFAPLDERLAAIDKQTKDVEAKIPTTLVMKERAEPKPAFILNRGQYDQKGKPVERRLPAALPPMPAELPRNRLGLAKWLVRPDHPLTARVTVNRIWQRFFGIGLVKTSEDFGNQGEPPSHPELLDWLALNFVADGWDVQRTVKRIVMSSTYRQASTTNPTLQTRDPENRWLARGPRFRLDGETLRDQALALSGLLSLKVGGPGVRPPQPTGLWKAVGFVGSNTDRFRPDQGSDKVHRRSLYTFWKRTSPPPQMTTFDAPSREDCRVRRERTNTPLQALLMMNDPQYVEAARYLALRVLTATDDKNATGEKYDASRATAMFEFATCRKPGPEDLEDLLGLLKAQRTEFGRHIAAARALLAIGSSKPSDAEKSLAPAELAAWTMVANLVLNLDEVITKN